MKKEYDFSIVTVCYNAKDSIAHTIESVLSQSMVKLQYIIIDGASNDGTMDIIQQYKDHIDVIVSEPDKGIYDAMNKGIKLSEGEYINFMNAGDYFINSNVLYGVKENKGADVLFGDIEVKKGQKRYVYIARPFYEHLPLHGSMGFTHQSTFVRIELAKIYPFDLKYRLAADYNMIITMYRHNASFKYVGFPVAYYDLFGISAQNRILHTFEVLSIDNPKQTYRNKLKTLLFELKYKTKSEIKNIIIAMFPNLIRKKHRKNSRFIEIE